MLNLRGHPDAPEQYPLYGWSTVKTGSWTEFSRGRVGGGTASRQPWGQELTAVYTSSEAHRQEVPSSSTAWRVTSLQAGAVGGTALQITIY